MRRTRPLRPLAPALAAALLVLGCGGDDGRAAPSDAPAATATTTAAAAAETLPAATARRFDAARALKLVDLQLRAGQRPAGSPQLRALAEQLRRRLPSGRFEDVPGHPGLRNVVGRLPGTRPAIVLGAHYDTEVEPPGFVGANDGAAGTAAVLEAARALRRVDRGRGAPEIRFVLFDGEEEPAPTEDFYRDALRGSKAYVSRHRRAVGAMVLLDYVANAGLRLPQEGTSDPALWAEVRAAARRAGVGAVFPDAVGAGVLDDHTPFLRAGIPAVDLIDFTYRHADTVQDTRDKLSERAMDATGETVVELLRRLRP